MAKQQHVGKTAHDVSAVPSAKLLQTRPFHNEHETEKQQSSQAEAQTQSVTGGWDLTQQILSATSPSTPSPTPVVGLPLQAKLTIGEPNDKYEQEADRVAHDVVQRINTPDTASSEDANDETSTAHSVQQVQRQIASPSMTGGFDLTTKWLSHSNPAPSTFGQPLQAKLTPRESPIQRETQEEDDELQMKPLLQRKSVSSGEASSELESSINHARSGGQPLDGTLQQSMGQAMGADFSGVKVHTDSTADTLNKSIQARAFTTGQDLFFRQGTYQPTSRTGQELIAHELTHVMQQNSGVIQRDLDESDLADPLKALDKFNKDNVNYYGSASSAVVVGILPKSKGFKILEKNEQYQRYKIKYYNWNSAIQDPTNRLEFHEVYVAVGDVDSGSTVQTDIDTNINPILPPTVAGIKQEDVFQNGLSDCYLQSALIAVASSSPQTIFNMITVNDDTVEVRLYMNNNKLPDFNTDNLVQTTITVRKSLFINTDGTLVYGGKLKPGSYLWPAFIQKAWAVIKQGYAETAFGMAGNAIKAMTGEGDYTAIQHGDDPSLQWDLYERMRDALQNHKAVALGTTTFAKTDWWKQYLNSRKQGAGPDDMPRGKVRVLHGYAVLALDKMNLQAASFQRSITNPILPTVKLTLRDPRDESGQTFTRDLEDVVKNQKFQSVHTG